MSVATGTRLGSYEILGLIGSGGMGEVYRARDTRLGREIAVKVLPAELSSDPEGRARFEREARAVATINHPNIVTIYSVEEVDGIPFLTMELVEGSKLSDVIPRGGLPVDRLLKVAIGIADAIAAAHQRGVTHRDLKPVNVMVTPAGQVKVLDFGVAKFQVVNDSDSVTVMAPTDLTGVGRIVGTVTYMSPEQAEGRTVDSRSDIFSVGVMLHQMATGETPFKGDTPMSILSSIVKDTPDSVTALRPALPPDLSRIIKRCLAKDPERRYQSATDLRNDLEEVLSTQQAGAASVSGAGFFARRAAGRRQSLTRAGMVIAVVVVVTLVGLAVRWRQATPPPDAPLSHTAMRMTRLTNTGKAQRAAIAPDGRYVAHVVNEGGQWSLWLRQVATASNVQIVPPAPSFYGGVTFSPDGSYVYYSVYERMHGVAALWRVPAIGGAPRRILNDVDSAVSFSPDGSRFVFVRNVMDPSEGHLVAANADGSGERLVASSKAPERLTLYVAPAWSPDGTHVAASTVLVRGSPEERIVVFDAGGGAARPLGTKRWQSVRGLAWLADGSALIVSATEEGVTNRQLWRVAYPGGEVSRVTSDLMNYEGVSLTADSRQLATVLTDTESHIWVTPPGDLSRARQVTSGTGGSDGVGGLAWTPDGRIVYASAASGNLDVWIMNADGSDQRPLTTHPDLDYDPAVTPDGRFVVFTSSRSGALQVWRMDIDGGNPVQLAAHNRSGRPECAGAFVFYNAVEPDEKRSVWRVPVAGGASVQVSDQPVRVQSVSPDGRFVAGTYWDPVAVRFSIAILTLGAPRPLAVLPIVPAPLAWTPDGDALTYVDRKDDATQLFSRPPGNGAARQLTTFTGQDIFDFAWSRDGRQLALARGTLTTDVVLLSARQ